MGRCQLGLGGMAEHLPHWFQRAAAGATLGMELGLVWMAFLPRRWRIACALIVAAWQIAVIATANYAVSKLPGAGIGGAAAG